MSAICSPTLKRLTHLNFVEGDFDFEQGFAHDRAELN